MSAGEEPRLLGDILSAVIDPLLVVEQLPAREPDNAPTPATGRGKEDHQRPHTPAVGSQGGFFAIDRRCWAKACSAGMNVAVAYLLQARGTGRDQRTTYWSVQALESYTGISRSRANAAIKTLQREGLTAEIQSGARPRYEIRPWSTVVRRDAKLTMTQAELLERIGAGEQPIGRHVQSADSLVRQGVLEKGEDGIYRVPEQQWIWLPNEFVTGAAGEIPPLELLRQSQDALALRLAVDLYRDQNLREDGGVSRHITWQKYERFEVGRQAQFTVWGFRRGGDWVRWNDTTRPHQRDEKHLTDEEKKAGKNCGVDFFARMQLLADLGLVEWVPHLVEGDGDDAEIIHPLAVNHDEPDRIENRIGEAAHDAGRSLLTDGQREWAASEGLVLAPVPRHLSKVQVTGIARLRYRPKTRMTAAWWADLQTSGEEYVRRYRHMIAPAIAAPASGHLATSR